MATGVLVIAVGPATKLIQYSQASQKAYEGSFKLGCRSDTEDATGEVEQIKSAPVVSKDHLVANLAKFAGTIQQTPPSYSAVKVEGQRAYKAARKGVSLEIASRPVRVDSIELLDFDYPHFSLRIRCGKGTYIRTLGRDIARSLGSDCVMTRLERIAVGQFCSESSLRVDEIENGSIEELVRDPTCMVDSLVKIELDGDQVEELRHGRRLSGLSNGSEQELVAVGEGGQLLAILERKCSDEFGAKINFAPLLFG